jgi:hypothetical protein
MRISAKLAAAVTTAAALMLFSPGVASAHAERSVGPFDFEIGFRDEPAYVGQPNAVFLDLSKGGNPVTDLGDALTVTVAFGDQTSDPFVFEPLDETPGQYQAPFVPSQAGAYTFTLAGTLDGTKFDLSLTSGPQTFDEVQDIAGATFPPVQYPTNAELATRIEQEAARTAKDLATVTSVANDASDAASSAKMVGIVGIAIGAAGLILAVVALTRKRA